MTTDDGHTWDELSQELIATDPAIGRSTMMGLPCLRLDGDFFASLDKRSGDLLVKLPADEVAVRVGNGDGHDFAPAGRVFKEWLAIPPGSEDAWRAAMAEALEFARSRAG